MNKKKIQIAACLLAGAIPVVGAVGANLDKKSPFAESIIAQMAYEPTIKAEVNNMEIALLDGNILDVTTNYSKYVTEKYYGKLDQYAPKPVTLTWTAEDGALYYTVSLSKSKDMSAPDTYQTYVNSLTLEDLFTGTDYY